MHAILPPSSANEWGKCTGWVPLNLSFPNEEDTEESRLGTAAHELASVLIMSGSVMQFSDWENMPTSTGIVVDQEMYDCASLYAKDVLDTLALHPSGDLRIEQSVDCHRIHAECFGTPDATLWVPSHKVLFIWDYKHGFDPVEVYQNEQLTTYLSGLLDHYQALDLDVTVVMRIVQPRAFHRSGSIREWSFNAAQVRGEVNRLANAAQLNISGQGQCQTGDHCKYCKARYGCEAAIKAGLSMFEACSAPIPIEMDNAAMGLHYSFLKRAEAHIKSQLAGFEAQVMGKLTKGEKVEGWELQDSYGNRKWTVSAEDIYYAGDSLGIDLRSEQVPISPAQAEKKGLPKDVVAIFAHSPKTGVALVKSDLTTALRRFM